MNSNKTALNWFKQDGAISTLIGKLKFVDYFTYPANTTLLKPESTYAGERHGPLFTGYSSFGNIDST